MPKLTLHSLNTLKCNRCLLKSVMIAACLLGLSLAFLVLFDGRSPTCLPMVLRSLALFFIFNRNQMSGRTFQLCQYLLLAVNNHQRSSFHQLFNTTQHPSTCLPTCLPMVMRSLASTWILGRVKELMKGRALVTVDGKQEILTKLKRPTRHLIPVEYKKYGKGPQNHWETCWRTSIKEYEKRKRKTEKTGCNHD